MDDRDEIVNRDLNATPGGTPPTHDAPVEGVPVPGDLRRAMDRIRNRAGHDAADERDIVREYQERYYPEPPDPPQRRSRLEMPDVQGKLPPAFNKPKRKAWEGPVDRNERKWAALAHASTLLTALVALGSAGAGVLLTMFVPLLIYFSFRNRSEYVAFHALQAFALQLIGTVGWLSLMVVGTVVWVALLILSALLILVLVGLILLPIVALLGPVFFLASLALPLGMVIYSVIAAVETWNGCDYRYPYIARWVESQSYVRTA